MIRLKIKKFPPVFAAEIAFVQHQSSNVKQANKEYSIILAEKMTQEDIKDKLFTIRNNMIFHLDDAQLLANCSFRVFTWNIVFY